MKKVIKKMIPKNLDECFEELKKSASPKQLEEFKNLPEEKYVQYHHTVGRQIRNNWGLWTDSELKQYFIALGLKHPDDMSGLILKSFHRHLNNQLLNIEEQIKYYIDYWGKIKSRQYNSVT